jgi:hypothetical protein
MIGLIKEEDGEAGIAAARGKTCSPKSRISKRETSPRAGSDYHLGMLSAPRALMDTEEWPDYEFDTQLGKGQTIYIIDGGYRSSHQVTMGKIGCFREIYLHHHRNYRHPGNALAGCGAPASKVKRQDDLPDLSCPSASDSGTSMTTMTVDPTTSSEASSTPPPTPTTSSETSSTTAAPPSTTSGSFCTIVYADGSSCVEVPDNTCAPGSMIVCPLAKRGAHAATATTFFASGSFVTALPTAVGMAA